MKIEFPEAIEQSRHALMNGMRVERKLEAEGGCGVIGLASSVALEGKYLFPSLHQMKNRGNGKGGGIAAVGLSSEQLGVTDEILFDCYILQVAYLEETAQKDVEEKAIEPFFDIVTSYPVPHLEHKKIGLQLKPPEVHRYFVRAKASALKTFIETHNLQRFDRNKVEDEFVYQKVFNLNRTFYHPLEKQHAFVLSAGKNMIVLKLVGYGDDVIKYWQLEELRAHVWIGHHRYPTKGKVWHPGGAHPFAAVHHALVHNGDFSNYIGTANYLAQRKMFPLFLTDTEVAILLFDLLNRQYGYTHEQMLEAMAPTTERDFYKLPEAKRALYTEIQAAHIGASPDGPWFFIVAGHDPYKKMFELFGITDTSMLRPQVFTVLDDKIKIGIIASEEQAIRAILRAMKKDGKITSSVPDRRWNARGGSHTDGGAYIFSVGYERTVKFENKFGKPVALSHGKYYDRAEKKVDISIVEAVTGIAERKRDDAFGFATFLTRKMKFLDFGTLDSILEKIANSALNDEQFRAFAIAVLTHLHDRHYDTGEKKRSSVIDLVEEYLDAVFHSTPKNGCLYSHIDWSERKKLPLPRENGTLIVDAADFPPQGDDGLSRFLVEAYLGGWKKFIVFNLRGHRFVGCGFGTRSESVRIDAYGEIGDYAGSGIDGLELYVHSNGQDQALNIAKSGKTVWYGDVGQTFGYGAKGSYFFVKGNAAGRPLINSVGTVRGVINGTVLDYLAEACMAGDPLNGGGFCILNAITFDEHGRITALEDPYPGGNLFSLASGGAIYVRDPAGLIEQNQLHGAKLVKLTTADWAVMKSVLEENSKLFGIPIATLLTVNGTRRSPEKVYRKVVPEKH